MTSSAERKARRARRRAAGKWTEKTLHEKFPELDNLRIFDLCPHFEGYVDRISENQTKAITWTDVLHELVLHADREGFETVPEEAWDKKLELLAKEYVGLDAPAPRKKEKPIRDFKLATFPHLATVEMNDLVIALHSQTMDPELSQCRLWFEEGPEGKVMMFTGTGEQARLAQYFLAGHAFARSHTMSELLEKAFENTSEY